MSDNSGILGEILEQGTSLVKQTVKQVAKTPSDLAKAGAKQVKGTDQTQLPDQTADLPAGPLRLSEASRQGEKAKTEEFVKDLYGVDNSKTRGKMRGSTSEEVEPLKIEDQQKLAKLRQELHSQYYQKLVNPSKAPEEKKAEKVEREKKEERWELEQKEKKKPPPLAVQRAAQKTEKFPGASG